MLDQSRDLLNADELLTQPLRPARWTKRLANVVIDTVFFFIIMLVVGFVLAILIPDTEQGVEPSNPWVDQLIGSLMLAGYYIVFEGWLGKTPGKMITRTRVVTTDGQSPSVNAIIGRNLVRLIPFDALTFIAQTPIGLHDRLAHTMVVDD
jgi:uncharacterized RDD family membrane protein YckC